MKIKDSRYGLKSFTAVLRHLVERCPPWKEKAGRAR